MDVLVIANQTDPLEKEYHQTSEVLLLREAILEIGNLLKTRPYPNLKIVIFGDLSVFNLLERNYPYQISQRIIEFFLQREVESFEFEKMVSDYNFRAVIIIQGGTLALRAVKDLRRRDPQKLIIPIASTGGLAKKLFQLEKESLTRNFSSIVDKLESELLYYVVWQEIFNNLVATYE